MLEAANGKKNNEAQLFAGNRTVKMLINDANVEATQKIDVDYEKVIDGANKKNSFISIIKSSKKSSAIGRSIFIRKRVTDDYVKSNTVPSAIGSVSPLKNKLELQDIHKNYELKESFSEGSQGIISTAFDKSLKRDIAIKSLKLDENRNRAREDESLFVSEARIMAQLDHPSIIPLYGLHCGTKSKLHLAMKHIHGKTLQNYLQAVTVLYGREGVANFDEKRSTATRIEYLIKVCEAVDYAHCKGVIHRDLKPENIMIGSYGEVYVMDWGLAWLVNPENFSGDERPAKNEERSKDELVGTPCYIAPELIRGEKYSPQSDIFSLGMILFEIITLERAVPGETLYDVLKNIIDGNYRLFKHRFLKRRLPSDLKAIIDKAICEPPYQRYKTAGDMAGDLKLYLMREETAARPDNRFRKYVRSMINHKMTTSIVILCLLLCLAGSTIYSLYKQNILIKKQRAREAMLTNFQHDVAQRAHEMERIFLHFRTQLASVAYQAGRILSSKADITARVYSLDDFRKASTAPADYVYSPAYDKKVSLDYAVFDLGPGVELADKLSRRVVTLRPMFKHIMFTSSPKFKHETKSSIKKIIINRGAPLSWVYIGLKDGSTLSYPGRVYSKDYDPRKRPWYKSALKQKDSVVWSKPYKDAFSPKIVMTCTRCVYDKENNFQGVVGMDISLDYIQKHLFGNQAAPGMKEYLLNEKGRIVLSSNFKNKKARTHREKATLILKKFPFLKEFQKAVEQKMVQFEAIKYKTKYIFGLNRIPSLGYYYIKQISDKRLRKTW